MVDMVQAPRPHLAHMYWGLPEGTHEGALARLPLDALFVGLGSVGLVGLGQKTLLLAIVFLAGFGMHRAAPVGATPARLFAGTLYAVNPFVYDRLQGGQWFLLLGYALLPWAVAAFCRLLERGWRDAWRFSAIAVATGIASVHMAALLAVLCLAILAARLAAGPTGARRGILGAAAAGGALAVLPSLYWLLPTPGLADFLGHIDPAHLDLYRTVGDPTWGRPLTVAGLHGFWNTHEPILDHLEAWPLFGIAFALLAAWGLRARRLDPVAWAIATAGALGFLIALGDTLPVTGDAYRFMVEHVSVARGFREPQKAVALLAFAYAYLGAAAVDELVASVAGDGRRRRMLVAAALLLALPLLAGHRTLGGLWGTLRPTSYPASWAQAQELLAGGADSAQTLFLPWHGYFATEFSHHRVIANPGAVYFSTPLLASRSVGGQAEDHDDPLEARIAALLDRGETTRRLGACLASLGVGHVLLAREADHERYAFLDRQRDLVVERRWPDLVLYRNTVPTSLATTRDRESGGCAPVAPLAVDRVDPARYRLATLPPEGQVVALGVSYRPGWMLGSEPATMRGGLPVFTATGTSGELRFEPAEIYRRNYLLGAAGAAVWLGVAVATIRAQRRCTSAGPGSRAPLTVVPR